MGKEKGTKAQGHKGTKWGEGITTDFTDGHGSRFALEPRQDRLALNLDRDRDLDPDRKAWREGEGRELGIRRDHDHD